MKRVAVSIFAAAAITLVALPVFASPEGKDDCLLYWKNCPNDRDSLPARIGKLKKELTKGEKVYTSEELNKLQQMLKEDTEIMKLLQKPGH